MDGGWFPFSSLLRGGAPLAPERAPPPPPPPSWFDWLRASVRLSAPRPPPPLRDDSAAGGDSGGGNSDGAGAAADVPARLLRGERAGLELNAVASLSLSA